MLPQDQGQDWSLDILTLVVLNLLETLIYIFNHFSTPTRCRYVTVSQAKSWEPFILNSQYHCCWWPGDRSSQGINSNNTDFLIPKYLNFRSRSVNLRHSPYTGTVDFSALHRPPLGPLHQTPSVDVVSTDTLHCLQTHHIWKKDNQLQLNLFFLKKYNQTSNISLQCRQAMLQLYQGAYYIRGLTMHAIGHSIAHL